MATALVRGDLPHAIEEAPNPVKEVATMAALRPRWRLIAGLVIAITTLTYLVCELITPLYATRAIVMIDPREAKRAASSADQTAMPPSEETVRKNEIAIIRSRSVAEAVIARLSLDRYPEFNPALRSTFWLHDVAEELVSLRARATSTLLSLLSPSEPARTTFRSLEDRGPERITDVFLDRLRVTSTDASRVIEIGFFSENAQRAALIANTIADEYVLYKSHLEIAEARSAAQYLEQNVEEINRKIRDSERAIEEMRSERGLLPTANVKVIIDQLSEVNKQLGAATAERVNAQGWLAELHSARGAGRPDSAASVLGSQLIQRLQAEGALLAAKIAEMSASYGENHPKMIEARAQLKDLRARIDAEVAKITTSNQNALVVAKAKEMQLRQELESLKSQVAKANTSEVDLRAMERETEANRTLQSKLVARLNEAKAQIGVQSPAAWIISKATVPRSPSFPPKLAMIGAALLISATAGTILFVLLERNDGSIRSMAQIRSLTPARVLGAIPMIKRKRSDRASPQSRILAGRRRSLFSENLRAAWFQIDSANPSPTKTMLITSSVSGEGKSTVAVSLACMLALAGRRVVIVDADLRHPNVHRMMQLQKSPGLAEVIAGEKELEEVLQVESASGAYVLAAGASVSSPGDILESPRLRQILLALSLDFDTVIIDSPPVLAVYDAGVVAQHADTTIMVVRWGDTKTATFVTALRRMSDLNIPVKGIVLSMVNSKKYGLYGYPDAEIFSAALRKYYSDS
jgi:capsular exopolysaccharide synthesis family protein